LGILLPMPSADVETGTPLVIDSSCVPVCTPYLRPRFCSKALGLDPLKENIVPLTGRPVKLSAGRPIRELLG
jgi:hypothetical protein